MEVISSFTRIEDQLKNKKIVYIATKNADYIRIVQEIKILKKYDADCKIIVSFNNNYYIRLISVILKILHQKFKNVDIVFVSFQAQFIIPFLSWKFKRCIIWTDFFISLYDTLVFDRKKVKEGSLSAQLFWKLDQITLKKSHQIICDTKAHGEYFSETFKIEYEKIHVLYLEADKTIYFPRKIEKPIQWKDKFLIFYFGSILPLQGVEIVLNAVDILKENKHIHFIIVGPIGKIYKKIESDTVTYINWLPQLDLAKYIAFSDLCLAGHFNGKILKANRTIPGKAYIYKSMNKKIVLGDSAANREIFTENSNIWFVTMGDAEELSNKLIKIIGSIKKVNIGNR